MVKNMKLIKETNILYGEDQKSKYFENRINNLTKGKEKNIRNDKESRFEYNSYRFPNNIAFALFPFINKNNKHLVSGKIKEMCFTRNLEKPLRNIYSDSLNKSQKHSTIKTNKLYNTIGPDSYFIKDLLTCRNIQDILEKSNIRVPTYNETFDNLPLLSYFNNITKGVWGEFFLGKQLNTWGYETKELEDDIFELFDSEIVSYQDYIDSKIYIDFKNYLNTKRDVKEIIKRTYYKTDTIIDKYPELKDKKIIIFYLSLYNNRKNAINTSGHGLISANKNIKIYDLGFLYKKHRNKVILDYYIDDKINQFITIRK